MVRAGAGDSGHFFAGNTSIGSDEQTSKPEDLYGWRVGHPTPLGAGVASVTCLLYLACILHLRHVPIHTSHISSIDSHTRLVVTVL